MEHGRKTYLHGRTASGDGAGARGMAMDMTTKGEGESTMQGSKSNDEGARHNFAFTET
ncbi:complex I NDUFA9 subunit family protein [Sesbania bispinosa]|nr:complex I NDUFA9 subunit family protein [Sesbania bispinosa]